MTNKDAIEVLNMVECHDALSQNAKDHAIKALKHAAYVDAYLENNFTIDELRKWLYRIAFNNSNNHFGDYCIEIVNRLDGFQNFVKDLREGRIA